MNQCLLYLSASALALAACTTAANDRGNLRIDSFNQAKKIMERSVVYDRRVTLYCEAAFDEKKNIRLPAGFSSPAHFAREKRVEWEHVVPAENFGQTFAEWRNGSPECVDSKGRSFKGRKCAEKVNPTFRRMQSDLYNLYPAIGSVNAERGHKNFELLSEGVPSAFGSCRMKVQGNRAEPPANARGVIARTYKYMAYAYPQYQMSDRQKRLLDVWDKAYPVQAWECKRAKRIEAIQGNENPFVKNPCKTRNQW